MANGLLTFGHNANNFGYSKISPEILQERRRNAAVGLKDRNHRRGYMCFKSNCGARCANPRSRIDFQP